MLTNRNGYSLWNSLIYLNCRNYHGQKYLLDKILHRPDQLERIKGAVPPRAEALKLYRDILKLSNEFNWINHQGVYWKDLIRKSAREEFEIASQEKDPVLVMKMIITSKEAIQRSKEKIIESLYKMTSDINENKFKP